MTAAGPLSAAGEGLIVDLKPSEDDEWFVANRLEEFNDALWPEHLPYFPLGIYRRDAGVMTAGLIGHAYAGQMFVKMLWVSEALRGRGIGSALLEEAEAQGRARGCHLIWLDTFSFQAPDFYRKHGFGEFARLPAPPYERILFRKALTG